MTHNLFSDRFADTQGVSSHGLHCLNTQICIQGLLVARVSAASGHHVNPSSVDAGKPTNVRVSGRAIFAELEQEYGAFSLTVNGCGVFNTSSTMLREIAKEGEIILMNILTPKKRQPPREPAPEVVGCISTLHEQPSSPENVSQKGETA